MDTLEGLLGGKDESDRLTKELADVLEGNNLGTVFGAITRVMIASVRCTHESPSDMDMLILRALVCTHIDMLLDECEKRGVAKQDVIGTILEVRANKEATCDE